MAAGAGFDVVLVDTEHAALAVADVLAHIRAAHAAGISAWVRVGRYDSADVGRLLDAGAQGIVFPHYGLRPEAREVISTLRYAPRGDRPTCTGTRGTAYGNSDFAAYARRADADLLAVGLIEDAEVVEKVDQALRDAPLQAVMPGGAGDLASSLGVHGQGRHPRVLSAIRRVVTAARTRPELAVGVYVSDVDSLDEMVALGADFYMFSIDYKILARAFRDVHSAWRSRLGSGGARP
jgi:2-keto-3-deoxy-L-rhamnonate aldolase RhmA